MAHDDDPFRDFAFDVLMAAGLGLTLALVALMFTLS